MAAGINTVRDVAQAVGLAEPDKDTPDDRKKRRDKLVDGLAELSPPLGAIKSVYDVTTGRRTEEENQTIRKDTARRRAQMGAVSGQTPDELDRARREHWEKRNAALGENAVVPVAGTMKLPDLKMPEAPPADLVRTVPIPKARPARPVVPTVPPVTAPTVSATSQPAKMPTPTERPAPIEVPLIPKIDEAAAAAAIGQALGAMSAKASEAATMMKGLLGFATGPTVDTSSIDAATGKASVAGPAMREALSVSATVQVNSGQIDAAISKANALRQALAGLGAATGGLRSGGAGKPKPSAGSAIGAMAKGFASGGHVRGPGTGTSDSILARLSNGEFVVNASATAQNRPVLEALNRGQRFHDPMTAFVREPRDGATSGRGGPSLAGAIGNTTNNTTNNWNPTFHIKSTDPKGAADEVGRVLSRVNRRSVSIAIDGRGAS